MMRQAEKRIYILYPLVSEMERYSLDVASVRGEQLQLGIFYLGLYLRQNGYVTVVTDAEALKLTEGRSSTRLGRLRRILSESALLPLHFVAFVSRELFHSK
jgi:hypothetical protein